MTRLIGAVPLAILLAVWIGGAGEAQSPDAAARRVDDRMRALRRENDQLAREATTLVGQLRGREIERDLRVQELKDAEARTLDAGRAVMRAAERLEAAEQAHIAQLPDVQATLVDIYKRGRSGYARLLFGAPDLRTMARATRAVAALASINERRIAEHRRLIDAISAERAALERSARELAAREADARTARAAADRAVAELSAAIARVDSRRDLTARYTGELQVAYDRIIQQVTSAAGRPREPVAVPLAPFRGSLDWPAAGRLTARFGQAAARLGGTAARNGIELSLPEDSPVRAIHGGTVGLAGPYTGFGNLVIVEHGGEAYSLYGYLSTVGVAPGESVEAGAQVGRSGSAPAGPPALFFELRVDGRSVDPLQWLRAR